MRSCLLLAAWLWSLSASAHPVYASLGEAELNRESGHLEIALRVSTHDLEQALAARAGKVIALEAPGAEAQIAAYVGEVFQIRDAAGARRPIEWVGLEAEITHGWLYFQVSLPAGKLGGVTVSHRAFFEQSPQQINTLNVTVDGALRTLVFTPSTPTASLWAPAKPAPARSIPEPAP